MRRTATTTPAGLQEFQNSDLGEVFAPPGGGLSIEDLDRCRGDYAVDDYAGEPCVMGVDVGTKFHVVVRTSLRAFETLLPEERDRFGRHGRRLWFAATVDSIAEVEQVMGRFNVERCVVDSQPEMHLVAGLAADYPDTVRLARYGRQEPSHVVQPAENGSPTIYAANRTIAIAETFQAFHDDRLPLPREARTLGGRMKAGIGEYYRELLALHRQLEPTPDGNWAERWLNRGADHFAHAEVYAQLAETVVEATRHGFVFRGLDPDW